MKRKCRNTIILQTNENIKRGKTEDIFYYDLLPLNILTTYHSPIIKLSTTRLAACSYSTHFCRVDRTQLTAYGSFLIFKLSSHIIQHSSLLVLQACTYYLLLMQNLQLA